MFKKLLFFILFYGLAAPSFAAPCYGTKMPKSRQFFSGVQTHAIFKRYLKDDRGRLRSTQNFLLLSYGIFDWLTLDLKGGAGNIKQHPPLSDEIDYPSSFAGGYGLRLKIYGREKTRAVFGFQHISVHPKRVHSGDITHKAVLDDWQFSLLVSRDIFKITPYIGARWSEIDYIHWTDESRKREKSDRTKNIGLILGLDLPITERVWFNLEGQLLDSQACAAGLNFSF